MTDQFTEEFFSWLNSGKTNIDQAAEELGNTRSTLEKWRSRGIPKGKQFACRALMDRHEQENDEIPARLIIEVEHEEFTRWNRAALTNGSIIESWAYWALRAEADAWEQEKKKTDPTYTNQFPFDERNQPSKLNHSLPRTYLAAGLPIDSQVEDTYATSEDYGDNYFAGTAQGESMHPTIKHGETALFLAKEHWRNPKLKKRDIYAFRVEGEKTIKRYNTRPATQQEIDDEVEYIYISSETGSPTVRVLLSDNPEHPEIIWRNGEVEAIGWFVKLLP